MVADLWIPLGADVLEAGWVDQREAYQKDVRLRVGQRSQSVVIFLTRRVPQTKIDRLAVHHNVCGIIIEHGRDVFPRKRIGRVAYQEACFTYCSVEIKRLGRTLNGLYRTLILMGRRLIRN